MSDFILMDHAKLTSPAWQEGIGLLAQSVTAEVDDEQRPVSVEIGRLVGPAALVKAAVARLAVGGLPVELASTADNGRTLSGVVRSLERTDPLASATAADMRTDESYRLRFDPPAAAGDGRATCTAATPMPAGHPGRWSHPDAEFVRDGEYRDHYRCPRCGLDFSVELPDA